VSVHPEIQQGVLMKSEMDGLVDYVVAKFIVCAIEYCNPEIEYRLVISRRVNRMLRKSKNWKARRVAGLKRDMRMAHG